jgi:hypothetical protein
LPDEQFLEPGSGDDCIRFEYTATEVVLLKKVKLWILGYVYFATIKKNKLLPYSRIHRFISMISSKSFIV